MEINSKALEILAQESWLPTPLLHAATLSGRLDADIWLKREDCTPIGSFKIRGGLVSMAMRHSSLPTQGVYVASAGNYGLGIAESGRRYQIKVTVFVPEAANPSKVEKIELTGATVVQYGTDFDAAKDYCRKQSQKDGAVFWEDGVIEEMSMGAATIAIELLEDSVDWDYVLVPLGNGSLIKGIASVFHERSPETKVVALGSTGAPAMVLGVTGKDWDESVPTSTEADGLDVRIPITPMVKELQALIDEAWLIDEALLLPATRTLMDLEQTFTEPSGAICVAALVTHKQELTGKKVAAIITGGHLRASLLSKVADSCGLSV